MKTLLAIIFCICFVNCSDDSNPLSPGAEMNYREIAYASLSEGEKESLSKDWREADVIQGEYGKDSIDNNIVINSENKMYFFLSDTTVNLSNNQVLVAVSFNTVNDALLGPITVIIDPRKETVIGYVGRL